MSVTITTDVFCDECGNWAHYGTHGSKATIAEALRAARAVGWTVKRNGHCTCPECNGTDRNYFRRALSEGTAPQLPNARREQKLRDLGGKSVNVMELFDAGRRKIGDGAPTA